MRRFLNGKRVLLEKTATRQAGRLHSHRRITDQSGRISVWPTDMALSEVHGDCQVANNTKFTFIHLQPELPKGIKLMFRTAAFRNFDKIKRGIKVVALLKG